MASTRPPEEVTTPAGGSACFLIAAAAGTVHGAFSVYWGLGGDWLLRTVGESLVEAFAGIRGVLVLVGLVKIVAAVVPWLSRGWRGPWRGIVRAVSWAGAVLLILWGGVNTVVGNLVLAGVVVPDSGYDRAGMIGHAWIWDPLFLLWGVALLLALLRSRRRRRGIR
ncbi:DUF3995 domain-containing protein [Kocuria coralli]|uniref:DUF3995 domain-containing protein n=1 Tax=Kocuria coralli TaxID=1461025 RepID=A0A5J5KZ39_9MICC|nr:DUF3995 domain-containing protein [Kocuria coralli]KAA9394822.1 DUF3995 domain-containing protein [Kocuria coralli]